MKSLPKQNETQIKRAIKKALDIHGVFHFYMLQGMGAYKGAPDMFALLYKNMRDPAIVFALEVKTKAGKLSEHQREFQRMWEAHGLPYLVVRSVEDVIKGMGLD